MLTSFAAGVYVYPQVPDRMPSHWNAAGQVDGYMPKLLSLFLIPFGSLMMLGLFLMIPRVSLLRKNIEGFRGYYDGFVVLLTFYLLYIQGLSIASALGYRFNLNQLLAPAASAFFVYLGVLLGKAKRNWFIGIRTPWTLSSDVVWDKTHRLGGRLFSACGIIALLGLLLPEYALLFVIVPVIAVAIYTCIYSYFEYRKTLKA